MPPKRDTSASESGSPPASPSKRSKADVAPWSVKEDKVFLDAILASYKPDFPAIRAELDRIAAENGQEVRSIKTVYARNEKIKKDVALILKAAGKK